MKNHVKMCALVLALLACGQGLGGEHEDCEPPQQGFLQRLQPVGGWLPYNEGLLRWWNPGCFPRCGGPNDYCPKPLPRVGFPAYPSFYIWAPPESGCPQTSLPHACQKPPYER